MDAKVERGCLLILVSLPAAPVVVSPFPFLLDDAALPFVPIKQRYGFECHGHEHRFRANAIPGPVLSTYSIPSRLHDFVLFDTGVDKLNGSHSNVY